MLKTLFHKNHVLFDDKIAFSKNVLIFCKHLSINSSPNHRIKEFESLITSEKIKSKNYFLLEDNCNILPQLNCENVSVLLETKVNKVLKWSYNQKNCALVEINDNNYSLRRDIRRNFGITGKSANNHLRYVPLNNYPKLLSDKRYQNQENDLIQRITYSKNESLLNVQYLRRNFKTNEDLVKYLLSDKEVSDLDLKIRFFIVSQLERYICQSYFKGYQILPFGSSIAGLGTPNSDLDLVLIPTQLENDSESKFEDRKRLKSNLNLIADLLQTSVPFYSHFSRILNARIPIIKFDFDLAPVDIDLSIELSPYSVHHGVYMCSFLNYCTQLIPEFRDFILLLRVWAKQHKLLKPKNWSTHLIYNGFTSFQLTSLAIFFFQRQGLLPPMKQFLNSNQPFIAPKITLDPIQVLADFFEFVLCQPFEWEGISILNGNAFPNPESGQCIYMENPFNTQLNMCRNVIRTRFKRFLDLTNICVDIMRTQGFSLAEIFDSDLLSPHSHNPKNNRIRVEDLFSES